jgi:hypothetical protein
MGESIMTSLGRLNGDWNASLAFLTPHYSRPSAEALKFVAEYAKTTLCWDCWKLARARGER